MSSILEALSRHHPRPADTQAPSPIHHRPPAWTDDIGWRAARPRRTSRSVILIGIVAGFAIAGLWSAYGVQVRHWLVGLLQTTSTPAVAAVSNPPAPPPPETAEAAVKPVAEQVVAHAPQPIAEQQHALNDEVPPYAEIANQPTRSRYDIEDPDPEPAGVSMADILPPGEVLPEDLGGAPGELSTNYEIVYEQPQTQSPQFQLTATLLGGGNDIAIVDGNVVRVGDRLFGGYIINEIGDGYIRCEGWPHRIGISN